nr:unnamed protein product [Callosobruchus analis]CAI5858293.1 unnamed protein product [Callosobruchus analis]CAI5858726.1 unnamed protein product [Callosobruchus analis]CAI5862863.1 unnamed protein product [Callosobruchus analis]
MLKNVF